MDIENLLPAEIERRSMEIIDSRLPKTDFSPDELAVLRRVIHTTADFDFAQNIRFSEGAADIGKKAFKSGSYVVTDTTMALAGINKPALEKCGCKAFCFIADPDTAETATARGITRSAAAVEKAARLYPAAIYAVGNAPTALIKICEYIDSGILNPALIIGVPVGFVNVVQSKELLIKTRVPYITVLGNKGGSTVAAAICNALMY